MLSLERDAIRSLIILLFLTAARGITINLKDGNSIKIEDVNENLMTVTLTKKDGTNMNNIFYTRSAKSTMQQNPPVLENDGDKIRVKYAISQTEFEIDDPRETIVITRTLADPAGEILDCFELTGDTQWFGGPELSYQKWPVQNMHYEEVPYLPKTQPENMVIAERYWLSSKGVYIYVNETSPLFLDQNNYRDKYLCMIAKNKGPYLHRNNIELKYTIGVFSDPKAAHQHAVKNYLGHPKGRPNERMIKSPIWSTWARYKANVNGTLVETYADEINAHGFSNSQIEIDDSWETCYGSAEFGAKFPDVRALIQRLKEKGFRVTVWIHPFINRDCEPAYSTALNNSYFVKNQDGNVRISWWKGSEAATIDFTNPKAVAWWIERLRNLVARDGIDSFKFDAGEVSWLPQIPVLSGSPELQPGIFTKEYARILADNFGDNIEVRTGWRTQELPIFVRMIDKDTRWSWNNGLPTLITTLLQMNLNGYVYVLPDMIGGNGYLDGSSNGTEYPSKEIFIRWLQANVFMPSLQYSFVPWYYDDEAIQICKYYTDLHAKFTPEIQIAMQLAVDNGTPVNPPIWWIDPTDINAHKINDEYLLGESILVAPVIEEGAVSRNIYLPEGKWLDMNHPEKEPYEGRRWVNDYYAPLEVLPYFKKQ